MDVGGDALHEYGLPTNVYTKSLHLYPYSVVSGRHLQPSGMPQLMPLDMIEHLHRNNITRVVVGHTPHGVSPTVIKHDVDHTRRNVVEVIMCDTSYSDPSHADNRGECVTEVVIDCDPCIGASIRGVISTREFAKKIEFQTSKALWIGYAHPCGWIKAKTTDDQYLLCQVTEGYSYKYILMDEQELLKSSLKCPT